MPHAARANRHGNFAVHTGPFDGWRASSASGEFASSTPHTLPHTCDHVTLGNPREPGWMRWPGSSSRRIAA